MTANIAKKILANWKLLSLTLAALLALGLLSGNLLPNTIIALSLLLNFAFALALVKRQLKTNEIKFDLEFLKDLKACFISLLAASTLTTIMALALALLNTLSIIAIGSSQYLISLSLFLLVLLSSPLIFIFGLSAWLTYSKVKQIEFSLKKTAVYILAFSLVTITIMGSILGYIGHIRYQKNRMEGIRRMSDEIETMKNRSLYDNYSSLRKKHIDQFKQLTVAKDLKHGKREIITNYQSLKGELERKKGLFLFMPGGQAAKLIANSVSEFMNLITRRFMLERFLSFAQESYQQLIDQKEKLDEREYQQWLQANFSTSKDQVTTAFATLPQAKQEVREMYQLQQRPTAEELIISPSFAARGRNISRTSRRLVVRSTTPISGVISRQSLLAYPLIVLLRHTWFYRYAYEGVLRTSYFTELYQTTATPTIEHLWEKRKINESLESKWVRYQVLGQSPLSED